MKGYIPEGGVWTAEEREAVRSWGAGFEGQLVSVPKADPTVAALIRALEDSHNYAKWKVIHLSSRIPCQKCALLAAVKGEK